jgi:hypothetical protein
MRKDIRVLFVSLLMSVTVVFAFSSPLPQAGDNKQAEDRINEEAARLYNTLSSLSMDDRRALFNGLTPEFKSALWKMHFKSYLSKHPDLTEKQREAIQSAIALATPQLFEISPDSPEWQTKAKEPLDRLTQQFLEVFPREVARELLAVLGGPEPKQESNLPLIKKTSLKFRPIIRNATQDVSCGCSTSSDWCSGESECLTDDCKQHRGCGTFFFFTCDGRCFVVIL